MIVAQKHLCSSGNILPFSHVLARPEEMPAGETVSSLHRSGRILQSVATALNAMPAHLGSYIIKLNIIIFVDIHTYCKVFIYIICIYIYIEISISTHIIYNKSQEI